MAKFDTWANTVIPRTSHRMFENIEGMHNVDPILGNYVRASVRDIRVRRTEDVARWEQEFIASVTFKGPDYQTIADRYQRLVVSAGPHREVLMREAPMEVVRRLVYACERDEELTALLCLAWRGTADKALSDVDMYGMAQQ